MTEFEIGERALLKHERGHLDNCIVRVKDFTFAGDPWVVVIEDNGVQFNSVGTEGTVTGTQASLIKLTEND